MTNAQAQQLIEAINNLTKQVASLKRIYAKSNKIEEETIFE